MTSLDLTYVPVAYDKSIRVKGNVFEAHVRFDALTEVFERHSMEEAQKLLDCFPDDVFEGPSAPMSVFYPRSSRCETAVI